MNATRDITLYFRECEIKLTKSVIDFDDIGALVDIHDKACSVKSLKRKYFFNAISKKKDIIIVRQLPTDQQLEKAFTDNVITENPILCCIVSYKINQALNRGINYLLYDHKKQFKQPVLYCPFFYLRLEFSFKIAFKVLDKLRQINKSCNLFIDLPENNHTLNVELPVLREYCKQNKLKNRCDHLEKEKYYAKKELINNENLPELYRFYVERLKE